VYRVSLAVIPESRFEGYGDSPAMEIDGDWHCAYFRGVIYGDLDVSFRLRSMVFPDSVGLGLPDQLAAFALDAGWTFRRADGLAFQVRGRPGLYSDLEGSVSDMFHVPFSLAAIRSFDERLSGIIGLDVRPGFEMPVMPRLGLAWEVFDTVRLEAGLPAGKLTWLVAADWSTHLAFEWRNTSFDLEDDHDQITVEDFRASWGLTRRLYEDLYLGGELGYVFERSVEFGEEFTEEVEVEDRMVFRFGLNGPF
jgi:hypothetical protein